MLHQLVILLLSFCIIRTNVLHTYMPYSLLIMVNIIIILVISIKLYINALIIIENDISIDLKEIIKNIFKN